jgi:hypothetical protein
MQQNEIYNILRGPSPKNKRQKGNESGINYPGELKTLNSSLLRFNLQIFGILDRSSQGVFVSKNQTKVTYPPSTTRARELQPPLYFRSQFLV